MIQSEDPRQDLLYIREHVRKKREAYIRHDFTRKQNDILKTFFDLAQEYDTLRDFYRICVVVPLESLGVESRLYLMRNDGEHQELELVCDTENGVYQEPGAVPEYVNISKKPYQTDTSFVVPIVRKYLPKNYVTGQAKHKVLGMLEVYPLEALTEADKFFFTKYTNRIAYNLSNRLIVRQNIQHLKFINNLVMDIEHNVITPNMYFKHLFNQLKRRLTDLEELQKVIEDMKNGQLELGPDKCEMVIGRIAQLHLDLTHNHKELNEHHAATSLFLESLFRKDHFERGHLVLKPKLCMVEKDIIIPQLENFLKRLKFYNITVEKPTDMLEEEVPLRVDKGLLAQVYSNLFSNAVKYTEGITTKAGTRRKAIAYGREVISDYYGAGKDGIKFNVFSTGPHLHENELETVFEDGYRGSNRDNKSGTGHGLSFIKQVIEIHGGRVGCELVEEGNNFYFVLPLPVG